MADLRLYFLRISALGLLLCAGIALLVGWLLAGRMLAPIDRITRAAANIAAGNLHRRVALAGPRDEVKHLADTFDGMLARLEQAFDAQGRFAADASHELLTPLATARTILETTSPGPKTAVELAALSTKLLTLNERSERIVEALLTLAKTDQAPVQARPVDLAVLVGNAVDRIRVQAAEREVTVETDVQPAVVGGNPVLCGNLADNLLANAVRYNRPGGTIRVSVSARPDGKVDFTVSNTGPPVPTESGGPALRTVRPRRGSKPPRRRVRPRSGPGDREGGGPRSLRHRRGARQSGRRPDRQRRPAGTARPVIGRGAPRSRSRGRPGRGTRPCGWRA